MENVDLKKIFLNAYIRDRLLGTGRFHSWSIEHANDMFLYLDEFNSVETEMTKFWNLLVAKHRQQGE